MLIAVVARLALKPVDVAAGVDNHVERFRRPANSNSQKVLAAALTRTGGDWSREILWMEYLRVHRHEIGLVGAGYSELELSIDGLDPG